MISISRLLCDTVSPGDSLRYGINPAANSADSAYYAEVPRPVVVWNCTSRCNLSCVHCYANADNSNSVGEMTTAHGMRLIEDLAEFRVPVILFSGGEPLLRKDIFDLAKYAVKHNIRVALSTNGTLINREVAETIRDIGFAEVGISLDGIGNRNDQFRGKQGAYDKAVRGIRACIACGVRVSLRLTITGYNYSEIPAIFKLVEQEGINRVCFYHLAYAGRGKNLREFDVTHAQTRNIIDIICRHTMDLHERGLPKEILTVGNHADGVYLYVKTLNSDPERAKKILELLKLNGGNNSGIRIGAIDAIGNVHPDQFWQHYSFGNARSRKFGDIWSDTSEPLLRKLRDRKQWLKGRCASCQFIHVCNGNLRVRAEAVSGDTWAPDPACYLKDEEIGL